MNFCQHCSSGLEASPQWGLLDNLTVAVGVSISLSILFLLRRLMDKSIVGGKMPNGVTSRPALTVGH